MGGETASWCRTSTKIGRSIPMEDHLIPRYVSMSAFSASTRPAVLWATPSSATRSKSTPAPPSSIATSPSPRFRTGAWAAPVTDSQTLEAERSEKQNAGLALDQEFFEELVGTATIMVAHRPVQLGPNQVIKAWLDQILVVAATQGEIFMGRDVATVVTRGGYYGEDGPRAGRDHGTPGWCASSVRSPAPTSGWSSTTLPSSGANPALDSFKEHAAAFAARNAS